MKSSIFNNVFASEKKYRAKMVKGKHGWLVKGMVFGTLLFGGMMMDSVSVDAAAWVPNTVEQIASRITEGQKSLTMIEGDTVYNIGLAINIKDPMQLLYDNGFKDGEQYTLPVGTVISWDGNHVTVTDPQGNVIGDTVVTDDQKHNPDLPVAGQASDTPQNTAAAPASNGSSSTQAARPQVPNTGGTTNGNGSTTSPSNPGTPETPVNPETPSNPEKPTEPTTPTDPEKPVVPEQPDNQTELEKLKALLAELEAKLVVAQQELATAQQNLDAAKAEENIDYDSEIAALQNTMAEKEASKTVIENDIAALNTQKAAAEAELATAQGTLDAALATQQEAQAAVTAAQAALNAIQETGDAEQIANAEAALQTAQAAYDGTSNQVNQAQAVVTEKQNQVAAVDGQIAAKQAELANCDTSAEVAKIAELETAKQNRPQQSIAELEKIVAEKQKVVDDLKAQIEDVKQQIAAIELKVDRTNAINQLKPLGYLTQELVDGYVARINSALSKGEIDSVVAEAQAKNAELKAQYDEEQAAKALQEAKTTALAQLESLTLPDESKAAYQVQINDAASVEAVNQALQAAKNEANDLANLASAKTTAKDQINGMNISDDEKQAFISQVEAAATIDEVTQIVNQATAISNENDAKDQLQAAKTKAKEEITSFNLSDDEKAQFVDQVENASTIDRVNTIVANAKAISDENNAKEEDARKLAQAKEEAVAKLEGMNLKDQLNSFKTQVSAATSVEQVNQIVTNAQAISDQNDADEQDAQELAQAKTEALAKLDTLNLKDQKQSFVDQVNAAQSVSVIERVLTEAQNVSDANDQSEQDAKELAEAKQNALTQLEGMNLKEQKQSFIDQVNAATSVTQVEGIVDDAQLISDQNNQDAQELANARTQATSTCNSMNLKDRKDEFINRLNAATTIAQINQIVAEAQAVSDENDRIDQEEQDARELQEAKDQALATIEALNLKDQKQSFIDQINAATVITDVNSILENAQKVSDQNDQDEQATKELTEAKTNAIAAINGLKYLSTAEKNQFINQVNAATTVSQVNTAVTAANAQNEANKPETEKTLEEVKREALDEIQRAGLGMNGVGYLSQVGRATSIEEVTKIMADFKVFMEIYNNKKDPSRPTIANSAQEAEDFRRTFDQMLNNYRDESGISAMGTNDILNKAADLRAKELETKFSHTRPNGSGAPTAILDVNNGTSPFTQVIENIAEGIKDWRYLSGETMARLMLDRWIASPGHDENLKYSVNTHYSVSYFIGSDGKLYFAFLSGRAK